ncbi:MAG: hypothetical protein J3Q66DRAFT_350850 [Benniella sp.]|nr:MAG: hypothetical protein J3Q66DRAFT_350850 [Benniella sp.]
MSVTPKILALLLFKVVLYNHLDEPLRALPIFPQPCQVTPNVRDNGRVPLHTDLCTLSQVVWAQVLTDQVVQFLNVEHGGEE